MEDLIHRYWGCLANEHIDHQDVKQTQHIANGEVGAIATGENWPVLWCRGLCPRAIHLLPPPPEESLTYLELPFPSNRMDCFGSLLCAHVFTDGSGGSTGPDAAGDVAGRLSRWMRKAKLQASQQVILGDHFRQSPVRNL